MPLSVAPVAYAHRAATAASKQESTGACYPRMQRSGSYIRSAPTPSSSVKLNRTRALSHSATLVFFIFINVLSGISAECSVLFPGRVAAAAPSSPPRPGLRGWPPEIEQQPAPIVDDNLVGVWERDVPPPSVTYTPEHAHTTRTMANNWGSWGSAPPHRPLLCSTIVFVFCYLCMQLH